MGFAPLIHEDDFIMLAHPDDYKSVLCSAIFVIQRDTLVDLGSILYKDELVDALHSFDVDECDITSICLTHTHADHFGDPSVFPNASVYVALKSYYLLRDEPLVALNHSFVYKNLSSRTESELIKDRLNEFRIMPLGYSGFFRAKTVEQFLSVESGLSYFAVSGHTSEDIIYRYGNKFMLGDSMSINPEICHSLSGFGVARRLKKHPEYLLLKSHQ